MFVAIKSHCHASVRDCDDYRFLKLFIVSFKDILMSVSRFPGQAYRGGFTLIELLVVISIIALLIGILLPALAAARGAARTSVSMTQIKNLNLALMAYAAERKDYMPVHSSSSTIGHPAYANPRTRWFDYLYPFLQTTDVFVSPNLNIDEREASTKLFAHTVGTDNEVSFAGYGYNFQYLGNSRFNPTFNASLNHLSSPSRTVAIGDCSGSRNGVAGAEPWAASEAIYSIDPPLGSSRGAHPTWRAYYAVGAEEPTGNPDTYLTRSWTKERNQGGVANVSFLDGHGNSVKVEVLDDSDGDGTLDNGNYNGHGRSDPSYN